jgi:hypothetical protein
MIGFINTLYSQLVLTSNTAIADLHNLQFTVTQYDSQSSLVVSW